MRKIVLIFLIIAALVFAFVGCSPEDENIESENSPVETTLLEGNGSGLWYMLSNGIAESLNKNYEGSIINITPGNSNTNILRLNKYESEFALIHNNLAYVAYKGEGSYEEPQDNIRAVATFYPSYAQFFLLKSTGIESIEDFIEEKPPLRFSIGSPGGTFETGFIQLMDSYGYTVEDLESWGCKIERKSQSDASKMFSDGALDGFFVVASAPNPIAVENSTNKDIVLLKMNPNMISEISEKYGYSESVIPKETYSFLNEDIVTFATYSFLAASDKTSEDTVYKVLKSMNDNLDYIKAIHASLRDLNPEYMIENQTIPMHPGAEKYYKEINLISEGSY